MYTYSQTTGALAHNGNPILVGYAGHGFGVNDPSMQEIHDIGPLPQGRYSMTALIDSPHTGLATIILDPDDSNLMFGRSGFRIHGDNSAHNQSASNGCIIAGHAAERTALWESEDRVLEVTV